MNRRNFLAATAYGVGWAASPVAIRAAQEARTGGSRARDVSKLVPPAGELIRVACAISKGTTEIDYVGPMAVFETWQRDPASNRPAPKFKIFTVSTSRDPVDGRIPDYTFASVPSPQIVIVPAQNGSPELLDWLRTVHTTADVTMSVCVGARHLALAGLLNGKPATTHHESIDQFAKQFPDVQWRRGVRFVENDKISTGGGLTAGIDLALHIVERYFGRAAAQGVADHLEYDGKRWMLPV
jgi:transcriptional regulator GlxA family with amidase domain